MLCSRKVCDGDEQIYGQRCLGLIQADDSRLILVCLLIINRSKQVFWIFRVASECESNRIKKLRAPSRDAVAMFHQGHVRRTRQKTFRD